MTLTNILIYNLNFEIKKLNNENKNFAKKKKSPLILLNILKPKRNLQKYNSEGAYLPLLKILF